MCVVVEVVIVLEEVVFYVVHYTFGLVFGFGVLGLVGLGGEAVMVG